MKNLIGISGYGGAGKDSIAEVFIKHGWERIAFADPLKRICSRLLDVPVSRWYARDQKSASLAAYGWPELTPDQVAIKMGTEVGRHIHPDVWTRMFEADYLTTIDGRDVRGVVVTDMRFPNEFETIKRLGGQTIRVERPGVGPRIDRATGMPHVSDIALDAYAFDNTIVNHGSLAELHETIERYFEAVLR